MRVVGWGVMAILAAMIAAAPVRAQAPAPVVGSATAVVPAVTGRLGNAERTIQVGDAVFFNQRIQSASVGETNLEFLDKTRLTVGPGAEVVLDRFVYDPNRGASEVAIGLVKGAVRFVSGTAPKDAYTIRTPTALLGIRGTQLRFQVQGEYTSVLVEEGAARMCHRTRHCTRITDARCKCMDLDLGSAATVYRNGKMVRQATGMDGPNPGALIQEANLRGLRRANIAAARSFASSVVTGNVSHIGNVGRPAALPSVTQTEQVSRVTTARAEALPSSEWRLVSGDPSIHFSEGTSFGSITAGGSKITALNQVGVESTSMERSFTMPSNSSIFNFITLANFVTNEFPDFVGTEFNDTATITIVSPSGQSQTFSAQSIFDASVNGRLFSPVAGLPSPLDESGGQTGFQNVTVSLPTYAAPGGTVRVIVSVQNVGDTAYPSAVLVTQTRGTAR
ncbi:FecR domain-containing protein [Microvirga sp. BT688]|uniref:FecR family protein n=1 Tax=Microvirga sp. TaxID=1873136 RepID=UPI001686C9E8|nr:FecR domain-containing protein [Microvirga sp.]MBD2748150.1 FecR domain-containing protein [Microvirga sp.]